LVVSRFVNYMIVFVGGHDGETCASILIYRRFEFSDLEFDAVAPSPLSYLLRAFIEYLKDPVRPFPVMFLNGAVTRF
jgi:hypothetical protein